MLKKILFHPLILLAALSVIVVVQSLKVESEIGIKSPKVTISIMEEKNLIDSSIYKISDQGQQVHITSSLLQIDDSGNIFGEEIDGFLLKEERSVDFKSDYLKYLEDKKMLTLKGEALFKSEGREHQAESITYKMVSGDISGQGNVQTKMKDEKTKDKLRIDADSFIANTSKKILRYKDRVKGKLERRRKYESGFSFSSDKLDYIDSLSELKLSGNVKFNRQNYTISAGKSDIFLENYNKKLKYFTFYDDIIYVEQLKVKGNSMKRRAYAQKIDGHNKSRTMTLSGSPKVIQQEEMIKGTKIKFKEKSDLIEIFDSESTLNIERN